MGFAFFSAPVVGNSETMPTSCGPSYERSGQETKTARASVVEAPPFLDWTTIMRQSFVRDHEFQIYAEPRLRLLQRIHLQSYRIPVA
jgi:hypothetical protein